MKIKADVNGKILGWGTEIQGDDYHGPLPEDFDATAGLGKYQFIGGEILEVDGWIAPEPAPEPVGEAAVEPEPESESGPIEPEV